jgi:hypothetical protein
MGKNVQQLEDKIEKLEYEIDMLKRSIHKLAITYVQNPKYPYWSKLLCFQIDDDKKNDFEFALSVLSDRLSQIKIIIVEDNEISDDMFISENTIIPRSKVQRFPENLFINSIPIWNDINKSLCSVLGFSGSNLRMLEELLIAMRSQGMFVQLINHFFSETD